MTFDTVDRILLSVFVVSALGAYILFEREQRYTQECINRSISQGFVPEECVHYMIKYGEEKKIRDKRRGWAHEALENIKNVRKENL